MAANDKTKAIWQRGLLYVGTAGATASTPLGFISREAGIEAKFDKSIERYRVEGLPGPAITKTVDTVVGASGRLVQVETEVLTHVLGVTPSGTVHTLGGSSFTDKQFSVRVVGTRRDGTSATLTMPYAQSVGNLAFKLSEKEVTELPFEFESQDDETLPPTLQTLATTTATLSSNVLTRTASQGYHLVAGEGALADVLDSITGDSLTNDELLILQIASAAQPITLTHLTDTLELTGSANWIMTNTADWIKLQYKTSGTKWVEVGRYDAPSA